MKKQHNEAPLSEEAELLIRYLDQYGNCKNKLKRLEARRKNIIRDFDNPLTGINYDGMPKGSSISVGAAGLAYRLDEIDSRILQQQNRAVLRSLWVPQRCFCHTDHWMRCLIT